MDSNTYYYQFKTSRGTVSLMPQPQGRYAIIYDDENLGSYHSPEATADNVSGEHTFSPSNGVEFDELDISGVLGDWERKLLVRINRLRTA